MESVKIPSCLSPFSEKLLKKQRSYVSIKAIPLDTALNADPLDLKSSKFLGTPFVPEGMDYPTDQDYSKEQSCDIQVLQIDTDDEIMFGGTGE